MSNSLGTDLNPIHKPRLGLALSGGGARGLAHIGVLKILAREGIPINCLSGTSMGGVIAAGYAAGMSPMDMEREAIATTRLRKLIRLADPGIPDPGPP
jgi:NTE family protein